MTNKLYYRDSYLTDFEATVLKEHRIGENFEVTLDRTAFYPSSGGQPHDWGSIEGHPVVEVLDGPDGTIIHRVGGQIPRMEVHCRIDWPRRFDHMQQHTGQHVLSQAFIRTASLATIGFHLGSEYSTIDLEAEKVSLEALCSAEDLANLIVYENRSVNAQMVSPEEASELKLRKPSSREGVLRVVTVKGFDVSACGGTHVRHTGEIGGIFINRVERVNRRTRVEFVCGQRSLRSYRLHLENLDRISKALSVARQDVPNRVDKQLQELKQLRKNLKVKNEWLTELLAQELYRQAPSKEGTRIVKHLFEGEERDFIKSLAQKLLACGSCWILLGNGGSQAQLVLAKSELLPGNLRPVMKECSRLISGKGGGTPTLVQGGGKDPARLQNALDYAEDWVLALTMT